MKTILYGLRASGKTTIGNELSKQSGNFFTDLDRKILETLQEKYGVGMNISRYVEEVCNGTWYKFRDQEHESLKKVLTGKSEIISLGGGSIAYDRNRHLIDPVDTYNLSPHLSIQTQKGVRERIFNREKYPKNSQRVFLDVSLEEQRKRLEEDSKGQEHRPDLGISLENIYTERRDIYRNFADITIKVDGKSIEEIVQEILGYTHTLVKNL